MKNLVPIIVFTLLLPQISLSQKRAELKKCIKTYREQFVQKSAIETSEAEMKKQIATYMILDGYDFMTQTDSSITFSKYSDWGSEIYIEPTAMDRIFIDPFYYFYMRKRGIVNVTIGWYNKEGGLDIWSESHFRQRASNEPRNCIMFELYKPLRNYLFRNLDGRQPDWPEELLSAVNSYNAERDRTSRMLVPNNIY